MNKQAVFFAVLLVCLHAASAQSPAPGAQQPPATQAAAANSVTAYAAEPLVLEQLSTIYRYQADGTGERTIHAVARIQSEAAARQYGVFTVAYAAGNENVEIRYLRVRKADGSVVETPSTDAQDQPTEVTRIAPFYSDLREKQYPVRSLGVGDTIEYECTIHMSKPQAILGEEGEFWGAELLPTNVVVLDENFELHLPRTRTLTVASARHKPEITDTPTERVYRWRYSQPKPTVPAPGSQGEGKAAKPDAGDPEPSGLPDIAWSSFKDWAAVGDWYRSLAAERATPTAELKAKAQTLTAGARTDEEKVRLIYAFVSSNIRYIGVAFGIGRYQPHAAAEVLANQYGDCKDKHTLLAALLAAAGVEASPVLIGDGIKFNPDLPAPSSFNHVITAVTLKDAPAPPNDATHPEQATHTVDRVWLDSTAEVAPYGMLSAPLRDKDALLMPSAGSPKLVRTPATLPFNAFDHWEAHATLDKDGKLIGHFDVTLRGDMELMLRWGLRQTTATQWPELGQNLSNNFGFSGKVTNFAPAPADKTDEPLHYSYDYERETYGDWPNHKILSLVPYGLFAIAQLEKKPSEPISTGSPRLESARSVIHLPQGYTATLPGAVHIRSSFASYDVTYTAAAGDVICETRLEVRASTLPVEKWEEYNTFARNIQENSEIFVQLHGTDGTAEAVTAGKTAEPAAAREGGGAGTVNDVNAAALLDEAGKLLQAQDLSGADSKIEAARKLNAEQWNVWALAGTSAIARAHVDEAETDYAKELALHPENDLALSSLAVLQIYRQERPQAIATLQKLLKLKPANEGVMEQLATLLTAEKRYPEALTLLQAAALKNPANKQLILQLGNTQLAAGRTEEAVATLHTALEEATDPLVLNNAAYELAVHNADLPLAESSARKALALLDAETQKFTLANVVATELSRTTLLSSTWDTLGWIEFQKGDAAAAEPLLKAAWHTSQPAEVGYHLGMLYEKLGKPKEAYEFYRRAQAADGAASFADSQELQARIAAIEKRGATAPPFDRNDLGGSRIFTLPLLTRKKAEGDYFFLLSAGKVEGASWIKGDEELKTLEPKLATLLASALNAPDKPSLFPRDSTAKQVRRGVLSCSILLHNCMLVLMLPQDAHVERAAQALRIAATASQ